ncbi:MAG: DNA-binding response OmpR family regulator [Cyclobacteriaceae bacterium]|jgi:DNA-binding response OmpR family regulator
MMKGFLLLIEDDPSLGMLMEDALLLAGYEVRWEKEGLSGWSAYNDDKYDLCIIDVMLPKMDGYTVAKNIRVNDLFTPIIFVTARSMEEDRLKGFEVGGDDYLLKPFSIKELICRVEVFVRRNNWSAPPSNAHELTFGKFIFIPDRFELRLGDLTTILTEREAELLLILAQRTGEVVKRSEILQKIWGEDDYFKGRSLDVFISRLRKYIKPDNSLSIRNHHGVGFSLRASQD